MVGSLFVQGMISFANLVIATFVLIFAIFFLRETVHTKYRYPWIFLLVAVIVFFSLQIVNVLSLFGFVEIGMYRFIFDLLFLAVILFTFIFQYTLILHSEKIMIMRQKQSKKHE